MRGLPLFLTVLAVSAGPFYTHGTYGTPGTLAPWHPGTMAPRHHGTQGTLGTDSWPVTFTDVAKEAGLVHPTIYGGIDRKRFIIETNGSGVALVDTDRDGWLDVLTLTGTRLEEGARKETRRTGQVRRPRIGSTETGGTARSRMSPIAPGYGVQVGRRACARATTTTTDGSTCS